MYDKLLELEVDPTWSVRGRIIPPSCSSGAGSVLHLQVQNESWHDNHYHIGKLPINGEAAVEFLMTLLYPPNMDLLVCSLQPEEQEEEIDYLRIDWLTKPVDTIAFGTVTGLTILVNSAGLSRLFSTSLKCKHCQVLESSTQSLLTSRLETLDPLMEIPTNGRNH